MHIVLCFGGRDFHNRVLVGQTLRAFASHVAPARWCIVHGDARGADRICGEWAAQHGIPEIKVPAPWDLYGKSAGPVRNQWMLDFCRPTYAIEFPGGSGTADMRRRLDAAGVPVWKITP